MLYGVINPFGQLGLRSEPHVQRSVSAEKKNKFASVAFIHVDIKYASVHEATWSGDTLTSASAVHLLRISGPFHQSNK